MAVRNVQLVPSKTYANEANLERAVKQLYDSWTESDLRYHIAWTKEGRCYPIFMGAACIQAGVQFHFCVIGG